MRGESGEAIVGSGTVLTDDMMGIRQDGGGVKSPASPPLSAAASQVSLAHSDLTISDPDIAGSSAYSSAPPSRPPSSSQMSLATSDYTNSELDLALASSNPSSAASSRPPSSSEFISTDIVLPAPEDYTTETVSFPTSPMAMKTEGAKENGVCFVEADETNKNSRCNTPNISFLSPDYRPDEVDNQGGTPKQGDGFEVGSDIEEDYFEEFHLPNSHENAFVRHQSFRRKVNLTPIDAPDAEKIEGLVRTGEFQRHGSIRRKITEEPESPEILKNGMMDLDSNENLRDVGTESSPPLSVGTFAKDLREIENMMDDEDNIGEDDISDIIRDTSFPRDDSNLGNDIISLNSHQSIQQSNTSTPISGSTKSSNYATMELSMSATDESIIDYTNDDESLSIEQSTLMKVRECLDYTKYKDLYNLSGRLQDILTPKEVEEILVNSDRYSDYVDKEVIEALQNSLQEQFQNSSGNVDSGILSPKRTISAEGAELSTSAKSEIRAELDNSDPPSNGIESANSSKRSSQIYTEDDFDDDDTGFRFERRRSLRLTKEGEKELEVEGVFVESKTQDMGLKKIPAPEFDLSGGTSEELNDIPDLSSADISNITPDGDTESASAKSRGSEGTPQEMLPVTLPDIIITNVGDDSEEVSEPNDSFAEILNEVSGVTNVTTPDVNTPESKFNYVEAEEDRPNSLNFGSLSQRKRISVAEDILQSPIDDDNISVASAFSQRSDVEDDIGEEFEATDLDDQSKIYPELELVPPPPDQLIPELSANEESMEERHWRSVVIGGVWRRIDMKVIAPYRKCVSHGGYLGETKHAIIVICACQLPDRTRRDYNYVMDNLFLYVLSTLEQLIVDDYILVYLAGGTPKSHMPNFHWLKRAYQMIDRKLRKNLKALHVVHPTFWVRTVVAFSRPFISTKFYRKLSFVSNLTELAQMVPLDQLEIPDAVKQADFELMIKEKKKSNAYRHRSMAATR